MDHHFLGNYMAHGFCFAWEPGLVWLHVISDILTGLAYYSIPVALFYFVYKRRDLPFLKIFILFGVFILFCGTTHLLAAYTVFVPAYWYEGFFKAVTAFVSIGSAILFIPMIPEAIAMPSFTKALEEIKSLNKTLEGQVQGMKIAEKKIQHSYDTQTAINMLLTFSLEEIPLEDILKRALDLILSIPWISFQSRGCIFLVKHNNPEILVMKSQSGIAESLLKACAEIPFGKCLCGLTASTQEMQFVDHINDRHEISYQGIMPHGHYCVPILFNRKVLGVVNIYVKEGHSGDSTEKEFLAAIANTLAGIIVRKQAERKLRESHKELEKAYNDLKLAQAQILQQEKMASIGQLAAGVAHEINNPTGFIISNLGSLQKYSGRLSEFIDVQSKAIHDLTNNAESERIDDKEVLRKLGEARKAFKIDYIIEDVRNLVQESLEGANRIKTIVQDLKSFSHANDSEYKMADINAGIESTLHIVWNELKYKTTVKKEFGDIPSTKCNLNQLNQVFMNILVNAAHAIEKQGNITVKTWSEDEHIRISIADSGCGISQENINRIFEPFFTTKEVGKGTGLGLSIAYDIVKKHKGEITVQSEPGKGTTFTIGIPLVN